MGKERRQYPRARIKWDVVVQTPHGLMRGVTLDVSPRSVFICCPEPLRLNELFEMAIRVPQLDRPLRAKAEVVWTNRYGPEDRITPRGMGVQFTTIADEDRDFLTAAVSSYLRLAREGPDSDIVRISTGEFDATEELPLQLDTADPNQG